MLEDRPCAQLLHDCKSRVDGKCTAHDASYAFCAKIRIDELEDSLGRLLKATHGTGVDLTPAAGIAVMTLSKEGL